MLYLYPHNITGKRTTGKSTAKPTSRKKVTFVEDPSIDEEEEK